MSVTMFKSIRILATLFLTMFAANFALAQANVGFAKYSPLKVFSDPELKNQSTQQVEFAQPLTILERNERAFLIEFESGKRWVHQSDLHEPVAERYVVSGRGYRATNRPVLRFWSSLSELSEFLSLADVSHTPPDFEETRTKTSAKKLRLPVIALDAADVMGERSIHLAGVMMPIKNGVADNFDEVRGAQSKVFEVSLVADVSPDALSFSAEVLKYLDSQLNRRALKSDDVYRVKLTTFGANLWSEFEDEGLIESGKLGSSLDAKGVKLTEYREPLLKALEHVSSQSKEEFDERVVVALSGADLMDGHYSQIQRKRISLQSPNLSFGENTSLVLAQVSPEPSSDLRTLYRSSIEAKNVVLKDFTSTLGNDILKEVLSSLSANEERKLSPDELSDICNDIEGKQTICVLPYAPTTTTTMPRPSRRGADAEWYTTTVWLVIDGLLLDMEE